MTALSAPVDYFNQQEQQPSDNNEKSSSTASTRECLLFPTYAYRNPEKSSEWIIRTKGWALSHNRSGAKQKLMTSLTKGVVGQNSSGDQTIFEERFKYFLAKNKRNKHFIIQPIGTTSLPSDSWTFLRRDSNGSTDSGFQSATTSSSKEDYFFWNYNDDLQFNDNNNNNDNNNDNNNNNNNNNDNIKINNNNNNMFMMMERPANPLSSILSGRRSLQSNTSISSTLSTSPDQPNQNQFYHHDEDNEDDGDDEEDEDDQLPSNEYYLTSSSAGSDLNSPSIITTTVTKPSLLNYPSFRSNHSLLSNTSNNNQNTTVVTSSSLSSTTPSLNQNINNSNSTLFKTESNGFFSGNIEFSHDQVLQWAKEQDCCDSRILKLQAIENKDDHHSFPMSQGIVNLIEPTGISIISDIDDTIKETQILHGARTVLQNTFFNPTNDIPGMAEAYMKWYTQGASFHYVSNSPFQLLPFLQNFLNESQFPPGSMHLRLDGSLLARLIEIPGRAKRDAILSIMNDFPKRQFVLVGDSGEIDLEIYTKIALEHPDRILKIFIHDITTKYAHYKQQKKIQTSLTTSTSTTTNHSTTSTSSSNTNGGSLSLASLFQTSSSSTTTSTKRKSSLSISTFINNNKNDDQQQENDHLSNSMDDLFSITRSTTTGSSNSSSPLSSSSSSFKSSSLLEMASSISSSSFLGLGKNNRTKTLADLVIEPSSSSTTTSSSYNNNNINNDLPPSQQCAQLYDRIKKAQDQLPSHIQIVLFQDADELRDDLAIQDALWQHWDNQC